MGSPSFFTLTSDLPEHFWLMYITKGSDIFHFLIVHCLRFDLLFVFGFQPFWILSVPTFIYSFHLSIFNILGSHLTQILFHPLSFIEFNFLKPYLSQLSYHSFCFGRFYFFVSFPPLLSFPPVSISSIVFARLDIYAEYTLF